MKKLFYILLFMTVGITTGFSQNLRKTNNAVLRFDSSHDKPIQNLATEFISNNTSKIQSTAPAFSFTESPYNHNMHITSDGTYYYTINGGSASNGQINKFDLNGVLLQTFSIGIDGRGLSYNFTDGFLYASVYGGDIVKITDLVTGAFTTLFSGAMQNSQASFAISPDGTKFYDFFQGTLRIHDFTTGSVINTLSGLLYGLGNYGGEAAVAVDSSHIYTWDAVTRNVYSYNLTGTLIQTLPLDSGDNGISLSIANGYLFVSKDANYAIGTWYGYSISSSTSITELQNNEPIIVYPNPTSGVINIDADIKTIEIFNVSGQKIFATTNINNLYQNKLDLSHLSKGIYFAKLDGGDFLQTTKIIIQ
ncbi:MAG: T9SS type A sorting domain-containing protein [Bacteroidia bacterium]|jgi:hypothetical protein|nr:T9SS type A sorting domain-containing protein [Bacteroidia bacterium]QQR96384.1 MAG: T9SS type A sorting domain-containing protein [Bacteroidota bacterium]MBP7713560.1 T9SS type A sorting domain-containing protein [Bacteroidia bacterium]MBP8667402.1 T9SS type A sorting domain-containing protein [Bacteroidia bacterium]HOZ89688.1 T9SS type A sorting domain-containing protein [Bacteroidia bacterium]